MKIQGLNPYLPSYEYIPDGEPRIFNNRVYIYGSHDRFDGEKFCMNDYVCWSAPADDLGNWRYEGVIYRKTQEPINASGERNLFAPDVEQGPDGRYYLYYSMMGTVSVAVCDSPAGKYEFYSYVQYPDGTQLGRKPGDNVNFDPAILVDDDRRVFLYSGVISDPDYREMIKNSGLLCDGSYCIELEQDMRTVKAAPVLVVPFDGEDYEGHIFHEGSSIRKVNNLYYFVYSSREGHELCYATCDIPNGRFAYGGILVSNGDIGFNGRDKKDAVNYTGNTHGGMLAVNGKNYIFYHRQTNLHHYSRQGCAEEIIINTDGSIEQVEMTSCGLNDGPLNGKGEYGFYIACNLLSSKGTCFYPHNKMEPEIHPYFTQDSPDADTDGHQFISNFCDGAVAGFKYFNFVNARSITVKARGNMNGLLEVYSSHDLPATTKTNELPVAVINLTPSSDWISFDAQINIENGISPLFFTFSGTGSADLMSFILA